MSSIVKSSHFTAFLLITSSSNLSDVYTFTESEQAKKGRDSEIRFTQKMLND